MKFIIKAISVSLLFTLAVSNSFADETKQGDNNAAKQAETKEHQKTLNPWIDCGIGAMIFPDTTWAAVSSNIIWDLGTTAVTSDQSSQHTCNSKKAQTAMYISATYANLEEETVKGNGQHVHAMLNMMGCDTAVQDGIIASVRTDFNASLQNAAYDKKSATNKAQDYYDLVNAKIKNGYAQSCRAL
ncbi:MAG: DUF3015 domain-containing protein [Gammaproteobacteria bacterium]|nr:DUF3015 domain-containing protein [Gammaproteobacteria bacterium]